MKFAALTLAEMSTQLWMKFLIVAFLAFIVGLEFREYLLSKKEDHLAIGSVRTYTFVAILGFVLYALDPGFRLFIAGFLFLTVLFAAFYLRKVETGQVGILQLLIGMIVYTFGPVIQLMPLWFLILLFVAIIFVLSARPLTQRVLEHMDQQELITLAKFLLLSAVILPLLPQEVPYPEIPASPFSIWMAVVIISSISYAGYILRRYVVPRRGYLITGIVGGLYSSTATTVVLVRGTRNETTPNRSVQAAVLAASGMMYLRLMLLVLVLNPAYLPWTGWPMALFGIGTLVVSYYFARLGERETLDASPQVADNPLAFGTAFLFAILFIVMLLLTRVVAQHFGSSGVKTLAFGVGFTDIDPFVMSLLKGAYPTLTAPQLSGALLVAAGSNDFLKGIYALVLGGWRTNRSVAGALFVLGALTLLYGVFLF
ncbi:MAG: DUF4010 domain-containing protein [Betaproteobacteria bacterium]|nr:DUF4010 domain-containing protein [Betaproteobacteria bacterium]MDE2622239.1 DUF4010 domain-containing protein [Betaproteobacteria bacterium]